MIILAVDPGHSVGFAARTEDHILAAGTVDYTTFLNATLDFIIVLLSVTPDLVVVEGVPKSNTDSITSEVYQMVLSYCKLRSIKCLVVVPGVWKPIMKGKKLDIGDHHRDALKLATYASQHLI